MTGRPSSGRSMIALAIVLAIHVGGIYFLTIGLRANQKTTDIVEHPSQLLFITLAGKPVTTVATRRHTQVIRDAGSARGNEAAVESSAIHTPAAIDWNSVKDQAVQQALAHQAAAREQRTFTAADRRVSIPMPKAIERSAIPWDRLHGKRAGLTDEGILFIKVSKKCMIVTVFLVCGFGGDIKPEGDLFEDLDQKLDNVREGELP